MYVFVEWTEKGRRLSVSERMIAGMRFRCVSIPERPRYLQRRRCARASRQQQREGIVRGVFPADFSCPGEFAKRGIYPADVLTLYRAMAAELVQVRLNSTGKAGSATVAVWADRLTEEVRRTVTELCIRNRYVMLAAGERDDVLCRRLRREYGVPLVQSRDAAQLERADLLVRFSPTEKFREEQETLDLFPGGEAVREQLRLPPELEEKLPQGCDRLQLLAALYGAGIVRAGQIEAVPAVLAGKG